MFKAGDKVYYYNHGIVELAASSCPHFPLKVLVENDEFTFTQCGRRYPDDKYPSLITLEEAEKRGFVRKIVRQEKFRVKYRDMYTKSALHVTDSEFKDVESFRKAKEYYAASEFVSFVDDQLQDCPPPQETIEWEEI
jgi:hypothetical protein